MQNSEFKEDPEIQKRIDAHVEKYSKETPVSLFAVYLFISFIPFFNLLALPLFYIIGKKEFVAKMFFWVIIIIHIIALLAAYFVKPLTYGVSK